MDTVSLDTSVFPPRLHVHDHFDPPSGCSEPDVLHVWHEDAVRRCEGYLRGYVFTECHFHSSVVDTVDQFFQKPSSRVWRLVEVEIEERDMRV